MKIKLLLIILFLILVSIFLDIDNKEKIKTKLTNSVSFLSFDYIEEKIKEDKKITTLVFTGDIMLARNVDYLTKKNNIKDYPFVNIKDYLKDSDFTIGNLEGPIVNNYFYVLSGTMRFSFPPSQAKILSDTGYDYLSLANNHLLDTAKDGFFETQQHLLDNNIISFGQPFESGSDEGVLIEHNDKKVKLFGLYTFNYDFDIEKAIVNISNQVSDDVLDIVFVHWGSEYKLVHNNYQENLAHRLLDGGVDMVIGHHPHVVQDIEIYNDKLIFYSLGNFIFDQYFSKETQEGLILKLSLSNRKNTVELIPVDIIRSQPILMNEDNKEIFLNNLFERSDVNKEMIKFKYEN